MKKKLIYLATLALTMGMFSACKKDKADEGNSKHNNYGGKRRRNPHSERRSGQDRKR